DFGDVPDLLETSLDFDHVVEIWQSIIKQDARLANDADCRPSDNAGNFLCDYTYFNSLTWFGRRHGKLEGGAAADRPVMFLHVPAESDAAMLEQGTAVAVALIQAMVDGFKRRRPVAQRT
ncbi:hypothetical protein LTR53_012268, partial [Teratosphaeriaceae sp. CCFEE 6253]